MSEFERGYMWAKLLPSVTDVEPLSVETQEFRDGWFTGHADIHGLPVSGPFKLYPAEKEPVAVFNEAL